MTNGTYSIPVEGGEGICVVTESNKGTRGWVLSRICGDPNSDYEIYEFTAGLTWGSGDDPEEVGTESARWGSPDTPTEAVDEHLKETFTLAFYNPNVGDVRMYGTRADFDLGVVLRSLKRSNNLL